MRLMTHNMLQCNVKKCTTNNYPLELQVSKLEMKETEKNPEFMRHMYRRIDGNVLKHVVDSLKLEHICFPAELTEEMLEEDAILDMLHKVLLEVHVIEGFMQCPNCLRRFPIQDGIPNMLLAEDEF